MKKDSVDADDSEKARLLDQLARIDYFGMITLVSTDKVALYPRLTPRGIIGVFAGSLPLWLFVIPDHAHSHNYCYRAFRPIRAH